VFDNRRYGTIRMHQAERGTGVGVGTELGALDIVRIAEGFGARGVRVDDDEGFEAVLRDALAADGPTVIHLPLDRRWVSVDDNPTVVARPAASGSVVAEEQRAEPSADPGPTPVSEPEPSEPASPEPTTLERATPEPVRPPPSDAAATADAAASGTTYHLVPAEVWESLPPDADYEPASLAIEGFVHCTDGVAGLQASGDRHLLADPRSFYVLTIDLGVLGDTWRYDDPGRRFPHIYGPIPRAAILRAVPAPRADDGTFSAFPA
jgi:uncharacterized protein (DUF952 family)